MIKPLQRVSSGSRLASLPPSALSTVVRLIHVENDSAGPVIVPATPWATITFFHSGGMTIAKDGIISEPFICGPLTKPFPISWLPSTTFVSAHIEPRFLSVLFGIDAATVCDHPVTLRDAVPGLKVAALQDCVGIVSHTSVWIAAMCDWLKDRLIARIGVQAPLYLPPGLIQRPTKSIADFFGLSTRQLERHYKAAYGLNMRESRKLERYFDTVCCLLRGPMHHGALTRIAVECGYHDQSHMVRDFQTFSGMAPRELLEAAAMRSEHRLYQYDTASLEVLLHSRAIVM